MSASDGSSRRYSAVALAAFAVALAGLIQIRNAPVRAGASASASYTADASTLFFENFENSIASDSRSPSVTFVDGFRGGKAVHLPDTASYVIFSDTVWQSQGGGAPNDGSLDSGTIEFYFQPDTNPTVPLAYIVSTDQKQAFGAGYFSIAVSAGTALRVDYGVVGVPAERTLNYDPQFNPGQWYHVATTWETAGGIKLYVNGTLRRQLSTILGVDSRSFALGAPVVSTGEGVRGRIDRLRLSWRARAETELPSALEVRIDSPLGNFSGETLYQPFHVAFRSEASDSPSIAVKLLLTTETEGRAGTEIATGLLATDTVSFRGIAPGRYKMIAVAQTSTETAWYVTDFLNIQPDLTIGTRVTQSGDGVGVCLMGRWAPAPGVWRAVRDRMLAGTIGRWLVDVYYRLLG
jgi:hypothetical protein